jgi:hypothetical protein
MVSKHSKSIQGNLRSTGRRIKIGGRSEGATLNFGKLTQNGRREYQKKILQAARYRPNQNAFKARF